MNYTQLNIDWNADPNAPEVTVQEMDGNVTLTFYLNAFVFEHFKENDIGKLTFINCHKYSFNTMNDEGYYRGQYRYKDSDLPWGEFYKIETDWISDFPKNKQILNLNSDPTQNHYIFFLRDNTFECVASDFILELPENRK